MPQLFDSVLVANRGEIACRVIRTLNTLGIRSIAVYSDADRNAKHVTDADSAVRLGPAPARDSYLSIEAVIAAARQAGATAIHPGYGFLSENAEFARACADAGIVFIGPGVTALEVMGDKIRSKNHVAASGVPVIPGDSRPGLSDDELVESAERVGYPLLIKPSAGGGGKGMEIVREAAGLRDALATARRVAAAAFGDDTLFLERLITEPRHIEVQLLADTHGTVLSLGERECSLQRRHQKVIEEAPSPLLDADTRARIGAAACRVAESVGYVGAGTVEFLVSAQAPDEFFFMEMNTRLQVEHPVTELVTGVDLVAEQVRIAAGEPLRVSQGDVTLSGHAVEARVYAENPERGFLPSTGRVLALVEPTGTGIRVDSGLAVGSEIGASYDPMLAKVIAWGATRAEALGRLDRALAETTIFGVRTNIEYLRLLLAEPEVQSGDLDTSLIDRRVSSLSFARPDDELLAAAALCVHAERSAPAAGSAWGRLDGWRLGDPRPSEYTFTIDDGRTATVSVLFSGAEASVRVNGGEAHTATLRRLDDVRWAFTWRSKTRMLSLLRTPAGVWVRRDGFSWELLLPSRAERLASRLAALARPGAAATPEVRAPMPGTVIAVPVETGSVVEAGATVVVVEAMKMEHKLLATVSGTVSVSVAPGDLVKLDQVVATLSPGEADAEDTAPEDTEPDDTEPADTEPPAIPPVEGDAA
ncbi:acetyl-CoA/propionyl-CoA carboxylase biotin carboxyl carrier protein [Okibacterium sp. HSC-33S16]|uniref:acetyl/propionyl/methylcrotonyl-CoA carboxylase subunit alpha n=1 Tax=Okibacterium sp. HSC-33S16 TaxID=2910965 RepID=UPI00209E1052|nr:biotin carboxylase N-terminal domain-containing protein [Okibacterium sp. HSC-33S16]MCP2031915.1 acetyl-CoA/propionyl-CoA carboxylase biotin carboxyl carrier protein [Okibacterium sp. HSC-33S16]